MHNNFGLKPTINALQKGIRQRGTDLSNEEVLKLLLPALDDISERLAKIENQKSNVVPLKPKNLGTEIIESNKKHGSKGMAVQWSGHCVESGSIVTLLHEASALSGRRITRSANFNGADGGPCRFTSFALVA